MFPKKNITDLHIHSPPLHFPINAATGGRLSARGTHACTADCPHLSLKRKKKNPHFASPCHGGRASNGVGAAAAGLR
jgi:hypothetical protein